jgi:hypothetical protein
VRRDITGEVSSIFFNNLLQYVLYILY